MAQRGKKPSMPQFPGDFIALGAKDGVLAEGTEVKIDYEAHIGHSLLSVVVSMFILGIGATLIYYGRE